MEAVNFDAAIAQAVNRNPELQAARQEIAKAEGRLLQSGRLSNPEVETSARMQRLVSQGQESQFGLGFAQAFPITNRLRLEKQVARLDVERSRAELRNRERIVAGETARAFIDALRAREKVVQSDAAMAVAGESAKLVAERFAGGQATESEVGLAQLEGIRLRAEMQAQQGEAAALLVVLKQKVGLKPDAPFELGDSLSEVIAHLESRAAGGLNRADLDALGITAEQARVSQELADKEKWGDWKLRLDYETARTEDEPLGYRRDHSIGLGVSIPLPLWNRNEGRIAEQRAAEEQARFEAVARRSLIASALGEAKKRLGGLRASLGTVREQTFPLLDKTEAGLLDAYKKRGADLTQLFLVRRERNVTRQNEVATLGDIATALSNLETERGTHPALRRASGKTSK